MYICVTFGFSCLGLGFRTCSYEPTVSLTAGGCGKGYIGHSSISSSLLIIAILRTYIDEEINSLARERVKPQDTSVHLSTRQASVGTCDPAISERPCRKICEQCMHSHRHCWPVRAAACGRSPTVHNVRQLHSSEHMTCIFAPKCPLGSTVGDGLGAEVPSGFVASWTPSEWLGVSKVA